MTRRSRLPILVLTALLASSCGGSLFKVKPVAELPPLPNNARSADAGGVTLRVAPLLSDEQSQELFEANLPLSGVLAVRVELVFQSGMAVELKRARFVLRDDHPERFYLEFTGGEERIAFLQGCFARVNAVQNIQAPSQARLAEFRSAAPGFSIFPNAR